MAIEVQDTTIDAVKGEVNQYDLDANIALVAGSDQIWFTVKKQKSDTDASAVVKKGLNVPLLSGITVTSEPNGTFRVTLDRADLLNVTERALLYDCKVKVAASGVIQTVTSGVMLLADSINKDAA